MAKRRRQSGMTPQYSTLSAPSARALPAPQMNAITPNADDPASYMINAYQNLGNVVMQRQQNQALMDAMQQQQAAELAAAQQEQIAKQQALAPLQGLTGFDGATLSNLDSSVLNTLVQDGLKKADAISKAQTLQEQFGRVQPGVNDANFLNLNPDNGYNMSGEQAALIAGNPAASQGIAEAVAAPQRVQMLQDSLNALVPDRSTMNGQKAYRNTYQELFGNAPVTDVQMQQEQAALQNALLGNQGQLINNTFAPLEKRLGLVNSQLDAQGKGIENQYKPLLNDASLLNTYAGIDSTKAGTIGKNIENEQKANDLMLEGQILSVMNDASIPIERRTAIVSTLQKDPQKLISTLAQLSQKGGVLGVKANEYKKAIDLVTSETQAANAPKPAKSAPAAMPAVKAPAKSTAKNGVYYDRGREFQLGSGPKTLGDVFGAGLRSIFTPDPNAPGVILSNQLKQQKTNTKKAPARPVTLPGIQAAKQKAQAGVKTKTQDMAAKQSLAAGYNNYLQQAEALLSNMSEQEKKRKTQAQGVLRY